MTRDLPAFTAIVRQGLGHMPPVPLSEVSAVEVEQIHAYLTRIGASAAAVPPAAAPGSYGAALGDLRSQIDRARRAHDLDGLAETAEAADRVSRDANLAAAFAIWEQESQRPAPAAGSAGRVREAAGRVLAAVPERERSGETHAFLAALNALAFSWDADGDEAQRQTILEALSRARALEPANPRVLFLAGVAGALAPEAAGGLAEAEGQLRQAQSRLPTTPQAGVWPAWTSADASAWLGRVLAQRGDLVGARRAYQRALELEPRFTWVSRVLLPALAGPPPPR
jgi:tetratricopeptide (TPR) repeat protein